MNIHTDRGLTLARRPDIHDHHRLNGSPPGAPVRAIVTTVMIAGFAGFAAIWLLMAAGMTASADRAVLLAFRTAANVTDPVGPAWFEEMMAEYSALGGYAILIMAMVIVSAGLLFTGHRALAVFLIGAFASGSIVSTVLKHLIERPRPDLVEHLDRTFTASFPSAHAMISTIAFLTMATVVVRLCSGHALRVFVLLTALAVGVLVGVSRVYLGVHWPSDVAAGWCLGLGWACAGWLVLHHFEQSSNRHSGELGHSKF